MSAQSKLRGHSIYYDGKQWRYSDTDEPTVGNWRNRPCGHCKLPNRPDDHDACLGELPDVINACCGHGTTTDAYVMFDADRITEGKHAMDVIDELKRNEN